MQRWLIRAVSSVLSTIFYLLEELGHPITDSIFKLKDPPNTKKVLSKLRKEAEAVMDKAGGYSEKTGFTESEKALAKYYFLLKHYIAEFESCFGLVPPLQIFNEHRMALDHIIRARCASGTTTETENMEKAANHVVRGLLDILKLTCARQRGKILKRHKRFPQKLSVLGGNYVETFIELQDAAEKSMKDAKHSDCGLCVLGIPDMDDVVKKFITAFIAHDKWYQYQHDRIGYVLVRRLWYYTVRGGSVITAIIVTLIANHFFDIVGKAIKFFGW
jgi:hypothetical protein